MRRDLFETLQAARAAKTPVVLATNLKTGAATLLYLYGKNGTKNWPHEVAEAARNALISDKPTTVETSEGSVFLNVFNPPLRMIVVGAVHISQALAPMAALAGYEVHVIDPRRAFATQERFPDVRLSHDWPDEAMAKLQPNLRTAVVTLTHDPKLDDPALESALKSDAFYVGALGSKKTHNNRLERLKARGFPTHELERIHGPVGLSIGARSPAEIAISILAQATETLRQAHVRT